MAGIIKYVGRGYEVRQTIKNLTFKCLHEFGLGNYILFFGCTARLVAS